VPTEPGKAGGSIWEVEGMQVVGTPDIDSALRVLDLGKADTAPLIRPNLAAPQRPVLGLV